MNLPKFEAEFFVGAKACRACDSLQVALDRSTGLCTDCWRIVVLAPAALGKTSESPVSVESLLACDSCHDTSI
jgi:hypothetical protein